MLLLRLTAVSPIDGRRNGLRKDLISHGDGRPADIDRQKTPEPSFGKSVHSAYLNPHELFFEMTG